MVALFLTLIITAGIYKGYVSYTTSNEAQEQVVEMQQSLRIGMERIIQDLRRAGMNNEDDKNAGFVTANASFVNFTMDIPANATATKGNGILGTPLSLEEDITYKVEDRLLKRKVMDNLGNGLFYSVIANVDALNFVYLDDNDTSLGPSVTATKLPKIRKVQVSLVVRTTREDYRYTDNQPYKNLRGDTIFTPPANDHFRRRLLSREVKIRNMGLK